MIYAWAESELVILFFFVFRKANERRNRASEYSLPSPTIPLFRSFLISTHASPPPASTPRQRPFPPHPFPPRALALAANRVGHASCQLDGAPSLRSFTSSKSSSASPASLALPCFSYFCSTRGQGGQQPVGNKHALLANEKRQRRGESHNAVARRRRDINSEKTNDSAVDVGR